MHSAPYSLDANKVSPYFDPSTALQVNDALQPPGLETESNYTPTGEEALFSHFVMASAVGCILRLNVLPLRLFHYKHGQ